MIEWNDKYGIFTANVGHLHLVCAWSSEGYKVSVGGRHYTKLEPDLKIAKRKAIVLARKMLTEALEILNNEEIKND
jgi:hypothetical protein